MPDTVQSILSRLEQLAPPALAESWDNVGLLIGDPAQRVTTVLIALDATPAVLEQAASAELLVTHHPLIFSGMKRLTEDRGVATLVRRFIREGRNLIALHTNLDSAPDGLNQYVAEKLGIRDLRPLIPTEARPLLKLVVYVPQTHVDAVRSAICAAGAGQIGHYGECTFGAPGVGTFRPDENTHPFIGEVGRLEQVAEIRLETVVPQSSLNAVLTAMFAHHPYEEVAYDLFTLENAWPGAGLGRVGILDAPVTAGAFLRRVADVLQTNRLALLGDGDRHISSVALCTGAGGDFIGQAARANADLYLTGEVKHHQALQARQLGIAIIDAGHYATERPAVSLLTEYLRTQFPRLAVIAAQETDPWSQR